MFFNRMRLLIICFCCTSLLACKKPVKNTSEEININIGHKMIEHFNAHDWENMAALYTEPALFLDPSFGKKAVQQTHKQTAEKYRRLQSTLPDIKDSIVSIHAAGENKVVLEFVSTGKAQDGSVFSIPICSVLTVKNGKISEDHTYYDNAGQE